MQTNLQEKSSAGRRDRKKRLCVPTQKVGALLGSSTQGAHFNKCRTAPEMSRIEACAHSPLSYLPFSPQVASITSSQFLHSGPDPLPLHTASYLESLTIVFLPPLSMLHFLSTK